MWSRITMGSSTSAAYFGHQRSIDYGATWTGLDGDIPGGTCSIAASPDDPDVLFVTVGTDIYESDDGGVTWVNLGTPDEARQGRIPFVAVNDRSGDAFDLWFGDIRLYRGSCTSNPDPGGTHCPAAWLDQDPPDIRHHRAGNWRFSAAIGTSGTSSLIPELRWTHVRPSSLPTVESTKTSPSRPHVISRSGGNRPRLLMAFGSGHSPAPTSPTPVPKGSTSDARTSAPSERFSVPPIRCPGTTKTAATASISPRIMDPLYTQYAVFLPAAPIVCTRVFQGSRSAVSSTRIRRTD